MGQSQSQLQQRRYGSIKIIQLGEERGKVEISEIQTRGKVRIIQGK